MKKPYRFLNGATVGPDGRVVSWPHCDKHPQITDKIRWPDGSEECMFCARGRQEALLSEDQKKNVSYNLPYVEDWVK